MLIPLLADVYLPKQSSTFAGDIDFLFNGLYWLSFVFFAIITIGTLWFAWKYRWKKGDAPRLTPGVAGNTAIELVWTIIPTILVVIIFALGFQWFIRLYVTPRHAYQISVTARQWGWTFTYPNGYKSTSLVLPAGRPVSLLMTSDDVIHSLFIPDFRVKMAVVPNRFTTLWFQSNDPGEHDLFCTEYCGDGHSRMYARVVVKADADFFKWLKDNELPANASPALIGERLYYTNQCNTCHSIDGKPLIGPSFKGIAGTKIKVITDGKEREVLVDENYLRDSILTPGKDIAIGMNNVPYINGMNPYHLSIDEMGAMIAFIQSKGDVAPAAPAVAPASTSAPAQSKEH